MEEKNMKELSSDELEFDLSPLFYQLKKNIRFIMIVTVIMIVISFVYTSFFIEKKYASQARVYITPKVTEGVVDYSSLNSSSLMVNNYISILKGDKIQSKVAMNLDKDFSSIRSSLLISNDSNTQIITIKSITNKPKLSKAIVDEMVSVFKTDMVELLDVKNLVVIDSARVNNSPVSPNLKKNILKGGVIGLAISIGYIVLKFLLDNRLHSKKEAEEYLGLAVLAEVPFYED